MTGPELHQQRLALGLTMKALADRLPVHWRTLQKWENGQRHISPLAAKRLEEVFRECTEVNNGEH
jgi:DNA-binding transcriptional regulator YiaG